MVLSKCAGAGVAAMMLSFSLALSTAFAGAASEGETTPNAGALGLDTVAARQKQMVGEAKSSSTLLTAQQLALAIDAGEDVTLVDVRTRDEYDCGHLAGAVWVPRGMLEFQAGAGKLGGTDSRLVVYCKKDGRAALAVRTLAQLGFTDVAYLEGGLKTWVESGRTIYNGHGEISVVNFGKSEPKTQSEH